MFLIIVGMWTMWFLIAIQLLHAIGASEFKMAHTVIGDAVMLSIYLSKLERGSCA